METINLNIKNGSVLYEQMSSEEIEIFNQNIYDACNGRLKINNEKYLVFNFNVGWRKLNVRHVEHSLSLISKGNHLEINNISSQPLRGIIEVYVSEELSNEYTLELQLAVYTGLWEISGVMGSFGFYKKNLGLGLKETLDHLSDTLLLLNRK